MTVQNIENAQLPQVSQAIHAQVQNMNYEKRAPTKRQSLTSASAPWQLGDPTHVEGDIVRTSRLEKFTVWILQVTAVAAAVVFGIWAPLSYQATLDGNSGNDDSSSAMLSAILSARRDASDAAKTQSAMLDAMHSRIAAVGQLRMYDFCLTVTSNAPCQTVLKQVDLASLASYLASITPPPSGNGFINSGIGGSSTLLGNSSSTVSTTTSSGISNGSKSPNVGATEKALISVPAILGIVFGVLLVSGWFIGVCLFFLKRHRLRHAEI